MPLQALVKDHPQCHVSPPHGDTLPELGYVLAQSDDLKTPARRIDRRWNWSKNSFGIIQKSRYRRFRQARGICMPTDLENRGERRAKTAWETARRHFLELLAQQPDNAECHSDLAAVLDNLSSFDYEQQDYGQSASLAREAISHEEQAGRMTRITLSTSSSCRRTISSWPSV